MTLQNTTACPLCGEETTDFEQHLKEEHYLTLRSYYEMDPPWPIEGSENRHPLTYIDPELYFIPKWDSLRSQYEKKQVVASIQSAVHDYFSKILSDRYLQMFLVSPFYFENTLSHTYEEFKDVLKEKKQDRNKIWFLDWKPGYPKVICKENLNGIMSVLIDNYYKVDSGKDKISINSWVIDFPDMVTYEPRHHSRYNIFNLKGGGDRRDTRRLRIGDTECLKFKNNPNGTHSILKLHDLEGNSVNLSEQDLTVTKLVLMRNKHFMRILGSVLEELVKNVSVLSDSAFLRNTVSINPKKDIKFNLMWTPDENPRDNYVNISIL